MFFNERDQPKTEITPFPVNDADKQYQLMDNTATQKIITAHRVTTPLLFGIRDTGGGFGSNKDEMAVGLEIFNKQVVEPYQAKIDKSLEELLSNQMPGVAFEIVPNTPLAVEQVKTPVAVTETVIQPAPAALNAEQITQIVQTVLSSTLPHLLDEKKKDDSTVGDALIALGEDAKEEWLLIDAYNADEEIEHEFAVRTGAARPSAQSEQDAVIEGKYFITRYVYAGSFTHDNMRPFCKKMIEAGKLYRKEDIVSMENVAVNPGWGPNGANTYDIWFYKGGGNCRHFWEKRVYVDAKGAKINPNDPDAKRIAVALAERMGYKVRNNALVAKLPEDMPYNGFLPTNPIYGNQ
jgi:hypothetical protein